MSLTANQQNWLKRVKEAEQSDQSLTHYAKQNRIPVGSLYSWKSYFKKRGLLGDTPSSFVAVKVAAKPAQARTVSVVIILPNGIRLSLDHLSVDMLKQLVSL